MKEKREEIKHGFSALLIFFGFTGDVTVEAFEDTPDIYRVQVVCSTDDLQGVQKAMDGMKLVLRFRSFSFWGVLSDGRSYKNMTISHTDLMVVTSQIKSLVEREFKAIQEGKL